MTFSLIPDPKYDPKSQNVPEKSIPLVNSFNPFRSLKWNST